MTVMYIYREMYMHIYKHTHIDIISISARYIFAEYISGDYIYSLNIFMW